MMINRIDDNINEIKDKLDDVIDYLEDVEVMPGMNQRNLDVAYSLLIEIKEMLWQKKTKNTDKEEVNIK